MIIEQGRKGSWNYRLKPVCVVGILNFAMEHEYGPEAGRWREKLIHRYRLREDETGEIMNSKLEFLYLEVGAFRKEISGSSPGTDKWMYALKNLSRLEERPQALRERVFERLFEAAKIAAYTKEERNQYENDMMTENDYRNTIDYARDEGRQEGLAEGEAKGKAEGKAEVARKMLAAGMSAEQVSEQSRGRQEDAGGGYVGGAGKRVHGIRRRTARRTEIVRDGQILPTATKYVNNLNGTPHPKDKNTIFVVAVLRIFGDGAAGQQGNSRMGRFLCRGRNLGCLVALSERHTFARRY